MNFGDAFLQAQAGSAIYRPSWNGKNQWVYVQYPDNHSKMTSPYLVLVQGENQTPWVPSTGDLFAEDWETKRI